MRVGDLVKSKTTGDLSIVTGVGQADNKMWITLRPVTPKCELGTGIVYHAEYFEVVSEGEVPDGV